MNHSDRNFYSGTSGLVLPVTKAFFPEAFRDKSRMEYYASLYNSLEVNSSFYKTPQTATVAKWAACLPTGFNLTFKLSKELTHAKGLQFNEELVAPFMKAIAPAATRKGILLVQFPPSVTIERLDRLETLLSEIKWHNEADWKVAVEFRHSSWYEKETTEILDEYEAAVVLHDISKSATPFELANGPVVYIRFHGPEGNYRGSYSDEYLSNFAARIRTWLKDGSIVFCYFNNTMGEAIKNLDTLNTLVKNGLPLSS